MMEILEQYDDWHNLEQKVYENLDDFRTILNFPLFNRNYYKIILTSIPVEALFTK